MNAGKQGDRWDWIWEEKWLVDVGRFMVRGTLGAVRVQLLEPWRECRWLKRGNLFSWSRRWILWHLLFLDHITMKAQYKFINRPVTSRFKRTIEQYICKNEPNPLSFKHQRHKVSQPLASKQKSTLLKGTFWSEHRTQVTFPGYQV